MAHYALLITISSSDAHLLIQVSTTSIPFTIYFIIIIIIILELTIKQEQLPK